MMHSTKPSVLSGGRRLAQVTALLDPWDTPLGDSTRTGSNGMSLRWRSPLIDRLFSLALHSMPPFRQTPWHTGWPSLLAESGRRFRREKCAGEKGSCWGSNFPALRFVLYRRSRPASRASTRTNAIQPWMEEGFPRVHIGLADSQRQGISQMQRAERVREVR